MRRLPLAVAGFALVAASCAACASSDQARSARSSAGPAASSVPTTTASTSAPTTTTTTPAGTTAAPATSTAPPPTTAPQAGPSQADAAPAPGPAANGQLPDANLTTVTPSCRIVSDVAPRLQALLAAAHADGIALWPETQPYTNGPTPPRLTSCYRDLAMQQWWRDYYCGLGSCGMAAVPGTSVHGWGRAVDFEEGGQEMAFDFDGYHWLVAHASTFGFFQPGWATSGGSAPEPWHWEAG